MRTSTKDTKKFLLGENGAKKFWAEIAVNSSARLEAASQRANFQKKVKIWESPPEWYSLSNFFFQMKQSLRNRANSATIKYFFPHVFPLCISKSVLRPTLLLSNFA